MRLLFADSDLPLADKVQKLLGREGFAVDCVDTQERLFEAATRVHYDLVVLGMGEPACADESTLQRFLSQFEKVPVIVVAACRKMGERIKLLNMGADDCLAKPLHMQELAAKIRSVLRRMPSAHTTPSISVHGPLRLLPESMGATLDDQPVNLTQREFRLLEALMRHRNQVLTRTQIEDSLYAFGDTAESNAVEVYVHQLRRKLRPDLINTIRGVGYQLSPSLENRMRTNGVVRAQTDRRRAALSPVC